MGDVEDGWNDWKRLLIEKREGEPSSIDNERQKKVGRGEEGERRLKDLRVQKDFHIKNEGRTRHVKSQTQVEARGSTWPGFSPSTQQLILSQPVSLDLKAMKWHGNTPDALH